MQLFRLMGMPDRMIAFNELPKDLIDGVDMCDESRMPRHWKDFIGVREREVHIPRDRDPLTGTVRTYAPIVQRAPYTFVIDWEINKDKERWQEIEAYVKRAAPKDFRLTERLVDMAKPMAVDAHAEMSLEPEDVVIVPLNGLIKDEPKQAEVRLLEPVQVVPPPTPAAPVAAPENVAPEKNAQPSTVVLTFPCNECEKVFESKPGLYLHRRKKHVPAKV